MFRFFFIKSDTTTYKVKFLKAAIRQTDLSLSIVVEKKRIFCAVIEEQTEVNCGMHERRYEIVRFTRLFSKASNGLFTFVFENSV